MTKGFKIRIRYRFRWSHAAVAIIIILLGSYIATHLKVNTLQVGSEKKAAPQSAAKTPAKGSGELPGAEQFKEAAESDSYQLLMDEKTGHFIVKSKVSDAIWYSYPDPNVWKEETIEGNWRLNLRSPIMIQYIDLSVNNPKPKETNFLKDGGQISDIEILPDGFKLVFNFPALQFSIPVKVLIDGDKVTTTIDEAEMKEGAFSILSLRLYPFFGAKTSSDRDGYLFIPDGSGALIDFKPGQSNGVYLFQERIYGNDLSFAIDPDYSREQVVMPVYGMKTGSKGFLAVVSEGAAFGEILGSPSGVFSSYNWITSQTHFRSSYKLVTNKDTDSYFVTYSDTERFHGNRSTDYYLLEGDAASYTGMAKRYRQHLIDEEGMSKLKIDTDQLPMNVALIGADIDKGFVLDKYIKQTTTADAKDIIQQLHDQGINNMSVSYLGWQKDGYSTLGAWPPVDKRIGGNKGMKSFVDFAHTLDIPVYLRANLAFNSSGDGGFSRRRDGIRNLGGTIVNEDLPFVSLKYLEKTMGKSLKAYKKLGIDGLEVEGLGSLLLSDYNSRYEASREESITLQNNIFNEIKESLGSVASVSSNFYGIAHVDRAVQISDDYSYDLFSSKSVPFAAIALHGLVPYTTNYSNNRDEPVREWLRAIESGAIPSYIFSAESSDKNKYSDGLYNYYSTDFSEWKDKAIAEYKEFNKVLGDVQGQFIVDHQILSDEVRMTVYENNKKIIVNYSSEPYSYKGISIDPLSYSVIEGGR